MRRPPPFREAFVGYHYVIGVATAGAYTGVVYGTTHRLLGDVSGVTRSSLYVSLAATTGVLLGFAITAVAVFTSLGPGAGLDLLAGEPEFGYATKILMGALHALAFGLLVATTLILADGESAGDRWIEAIGVLAVTLALLRTWALVWLMSKLLGLAITDRQRQAGERAKP